MALCGTCEQCGGGAGGKCPHGFYRHGGCVRCAHEAIDSALAALSTGDSPEGAIALLEEVRRARA